MHTHKHIDYYVPIQNAMLRSEIKTVNMGLEHLKSKMTQEL